MQHGRLTQSHCLLFTSLILAAATSESHSWLLTLVIALSTQLVRFLHCWDFLAFGSCICFEEQLPYTAIHWDLSDTHQAISFDNSGCKLSTHTHWLSRVNLIISDARHALSPSHTFISPLCCWLLLLNLIQPSLSLKSLNALLACKQTCLLLLEYLAHTLCVIAHSI